MNKNAIVLDLESQKTFAEVGGQHAREKLGVSFVGIYSYKQDQYYGFWEKDLNKLERILAKEKPLLIGFNTISFDNVVLQPYFKNFKLASLPQLDILAEIEKQLKFRIKLESVAQATLGYGKSGTGLDAINYYRTKQFEKLARYCLDDVKVTKRVYEYGLRHGHLWYTTAGNYAPIPAVWKETPTILEILQRAQQSHQGLKIKYFEILENNSRQISEREVDILDLAAQKLTAYCHVSGKKRDFTIKQILEAKNTAQVFAHQTALI